MLHPRMCTSEASVMDTPAPPPFAVVLNVPLISRLQSVMSRDREISNVSVSSGPTTAAPLGPELVVIAWGFWGGTFSGQVPVTVMVRGRVWPTAFGGAVMVVKS